LISTCLDPSLLARCQSDTLDKFARGEGGSRWQDPGPPIGMIMLSQGDQTARDVAEVVPRAGYVDPAGPAYGLDLGVPARRSRRSQCLRRRALRAKTNAVARTHNCSAVVPTEVSGPGSTPASSTSGRPSATVAIPPAMTSQRGASPLRHAKTMVQPSQPTANSDTPSNSPIPPP
jgi:hypothetical protein